MAKFGKTQQTEEEFYRRFEIFRSNYKRIVDHNAIPDSGFELEINQFADLTDEEFISTHTGLKVPKHVTERLEREGLSIPAEEDYATTRTKERRRLEIIRSKEKYHDMMNDRMMVQSSSDSSETGEDDFIFTDSGNNPEDADVEIKPYVNWYKDGYVSSPYDQGHCGGCWAFSTAAAVESLCKISNPTNATCPDGLQEFSVQYLLDCDKEDYGGDNYGCIGGWMY